MRLFILALAALAVGGDAPAQTAPPPESRVFRDWLAVCDNTNDCVAFGGASWAGGWIRIARPAGPGAAPSVHVNLWSSEGAMTAALDGEPLSLVEDSAVGAFAAPDALATARALARGAQVTVDGDESAQISLSGVAAALLWIDERQGRLGASDAFMRPGDRDPSTAPQAPARPVLHAAPAISQTGFEGDAPALPGALTSLPAVADCREETAWNAHLQGETIAARLDPETVLWGVPCFAGAYNLGFRFWTITDDSPPEPVRFPGALSEPADDLINPMYDPDTRILSAFAKGRGLGDCGLHQQWVWTASGFALALEVEMPECFAVLPDLWPVSWRAEVR